MSEKRKTFVIIHFEFLDYYRNKEMGLIAHRMIADGYRLVFIAPKENCETATNWPDGFELVPCPGDSLSQEWILCYLENIGSELYGVFSYMCSKVYRYIIPFCKRCGAHSIIHMDAYRIEESKKISRFHATSRALLGASAILCQEPEMIDNFASAKVRERCVLFPASFDASRADGIRPKASESRKQILVSGQIYPLKRTHLAVKVFLNLLSESAELRDWKLLVAGPAIDQSYMREIQATIKSSPHSPAVELKGQLSGKDYYETIASCSILFHPSSREGQANVFPEAMHFGLAILTTRGSRVRYTLENGLCGRVVAIDDEPGLKQALKELMTNGETLTELEERARVRQSSLFDFDKNFLELSRAISVRV